MKVYALITPDDVRTNITQCFWDYRQLRAECVGKIRSWIISRNDIVNHFQYFKMLLCHCDQVVAVFSLQKMNNLLGVMLRSVYWCLNYKLIQRHREPGNRSGGWNCLLYTSPSPRDRTRSRMPSSA